MEEVKTFNFDTGANSLLASVLPALANRGVDTNALLAMCNKGGNGFPEYDYLYLQEDKGGQWQGLLVDEINKFFKE